MTIVPMIPLTRGDSVDLPLAPATHDPERFATCGNVIAA